MDAVVATERRVDIEVNDREILALLLFSGESGWHEISYI